MATIATRTAKCEVETLTSYCRGPHLCPDPDPRVTIAETREDEFLGHCFFFLDTTYFWIILALFPTLALIS